MNTTFSIITISRNNLKGLKSTYTSLKHQTCDSYEWIVIDGASEDETARFLENTNAEWTSEPDNGIYDAMNKGLERSKGQYLLFLNAGDTLASGETLEYLKTAADFNRALIYGDSYEDKRYKPARSHLKITRGLFTHHQAILYNREKLGELRYSDDYSIAADYYLTARFLQQNGNDALYCPFPICHFESGGVSQTQAQKGRAEQFKVRTQLKLCNPLTNTMIYLVQALAWSFRTAAPNLYWHLKSSGNKKRETSQNQIRMPHRETQA